MQDVQPASIIPGLPADNLFQVMDHWVAVQPDALLFSFLDSHGHELERLTYGQFAGRVNTLAGHFHETIDAEPGARILLCYQPGLEMVCALFACNKAGYIGVPTLPLDVQRLPAWMVAIGHILDDSGATGVAMCATTWKILDACHPDDADGSAVRDRLIEMAPLITTGLTGDAAARPPGAPCETFFLQYTSGSTTDPRGVMVSHANLLANAEAVVDHGHAVAVSWLPQHHDMGLIGYYINVVLSGGCTYGFSPGSFIKRPALWLETITRYSGTASSITNFAVELCLNDRRVPPATLDKFDLSSLRFLMVAAEPVNVANFFAFGRKFAACGLKPESMFVAYGLAEFTLAVSSYGRRSMSLDREALSLGVVKPAEDTASRPPVDLMSCGRSLGDTGIRIVDPDSRLPVADGRTGEVWLAGRSKSRGYWNKAALNDEVFEAGLDPSLGRTEHFLRTGDVGYLDEGELFICGRIKDMLILHGRNIYPQDIESEVQGAAPEIRSNSVVAFVDENGSGVTVLAEVARASNMPDGLGIIRAIRERLQVPVTDLAFLAPRSIARTSSGKIRRAATRDLYEKGRLRVLARARPDDTNEAEHAAAGIPDELESLQRRYRLTGAEDMTLLEAGVDSLDLVTTLHWMKDECRARGAANLADRITVRLFGSLTVRQVFEAGRMLSAAPRIAGDRLADLVREAMQARIAREREQMKADSVYRRPGCGADRRRPVASGTGDILLTGGTGFLGPFLLASLLQQTDRRIHVLVRGRTADQAAGRLRREFEEAIGPTAPMADFDKRVVPLHGDIAAPKFRLTDAQWDALAECVGTIYHNAALVNYLLDYRHTRAANVAGTTRVIDLALTGMPKALNHVSTTFIFGWATRDVLYETDRNSEMDHLDFGYSQSKWVAEQLVLSAMEQGLQARIFRPALITPALDGRGTNLDIALRLLAFMVTHGVSVETRNQVSFMPVDVAADNIVAIAGLADTVNETFHVTRERLETMPEITEIISRQVGIRFTPFALREFVPEVIRRCTRDDALFPLLDFLVESVDNIAAMEYKLYDNSRYRDARDRSRFGRQDAPLEDVVAGIIRFLRRRELLPDGRPA